MKHNLAAMVVLLAAAIPAVAAEDVYVIDPGHTIPSFEVAHAGGFTTTRGFFLKTSGKITMDRAAKTGSIDIAIETASVDTANPRRDELVRSWLKADQAPTITYKSKNLKFSGDNVTGADGELTLGGVTKPVALTLSSFKCRPHPVNKKDQCGADGWAQIKRSDFGITSGLSSASDEVKVLFQIETFKE